MGERLLIALKYIFACILVIPPALVAIAILLVLGMAAFMVYMVAVVIVTVITGPAIIIEYVVMGFVWLFTGGTWFYDIKPCHAHAYTAVPLLWLDDLLEEINN